MGRQGYITLREALNKVLFQKEEGGMHKYFILKSYALDFVRDLYTDTPQEVKTKKIPMSALKTIDLPQDYVALVKIGVQVGDKVRVYLKDNQIATYFDKTDCGEEQANASATVDTDDPTGYPFYFANYVNDYGEHIGGFFGYGAGPISDGYKINGRTIYFNSDVDTSDVYLEYVSNGFNPNEETLIPELSKKALEYYVKWQYDCDKKGPNSADAMGWRQMFGKEWTKMKIRMEPLSVEDILYSSRTGYSLSVKA